MSKRNILFFIQFICLGFIGTGIYFSLQSSTTAISGTVIACLAGAGLLTLVSSFILPRFYRKTSSGPGSIDTLIKEYQALSSRNAELEELALVALRTNDGVLLCNEKGEISWANTAFQRLTGYSLDECIGKKPHEVLHGPLTNKETLAEIFKKLSNREIFRGEILDYKKNGEPFWTDLSISPIEENGKMTGAVSILRDVSVEKSGRDQIEASEWRHRLLFEDLPLPMMVMDTETTQFVSANKAACRTYGYTKEEFSKLRLEDILVDAGKTRAPGFKERFASIPLMEATHTHRRKDGSIIQMEISSYLTEIDGRKVRLSLNKDVSRTVAAEKALSMSEERFASFMEYSPAVAWIKDNEGRYVYVNNAFSEKFSVSNHDAIDKMDSDLLPQQYADEIDAYDKRVAHGESFEIFSSIPTPDGTMRDWWIIKFPIQSSTGDTFICGLAHDITDKRKAEKALEDSERRYRLISENSRDLICLHDLDGKCNFVSPSITYLTGYAPGELLNRYISDFATEDYKDYLKNEYDPLSPEYKGGLIEYKFQRKDGTTIWLETATQPISGENGNAIQVLSVSRDITTRKEAELKLERFAHHLQQTNEELKEAKESAEKSARIKEEFLANTSHEIRTPMNAILGLTRILLDSELNDKQIEYLKAIQTSGDTLLVVINDILDLSKIEAGKLSLEEIPFDLTESIHFACNLLKPKAIEKNISLTCSTGSALPKVMGDPVRLNQILLNIIGNAIKFTHIGEVVVSVDDVLQQNDTYDVLFSIKDTGIGIPASQISNIFQSFTQVSSSTTRQYGGTGLGLAIVKRLVELHNGSIQVKSRENEGSVFSFRLKYKIPVETSEEIISPSTKSKSELVNKKGLLVEDNPINLMVARKVLNGFGMDIICATNGEEALSKLREDIFDIVFMDIQMPGLDGYQTTELIRAGESESGRHVPVMAMTANATTGEAEKCLEFGMDAYISKPFDTDNLYNTILGLLFKNKEALYEQRSGEIIR